MFEKDKNTGDCGITGRGLHTIADPPAGFSIDVNNFQEEIKNERK